MKLRDHAVALVVPILVALALSLPLFDRMQGLSIDLLFLLRNGLFPAQAEAPDSKVAVIAIDEATYYSDTQPFKGSPRVFWSKPLGQVLDAVIEGGAAVVGFDLILPTSVRHLAEDKDIEQPFLEALQRGREAKKVVLGSVTLGQRSILPHKTQRHIVRGQNIRSLNVILDSDGVIRFLPLVFRSARDGGLVPSMSLELAKRALQTEIEIDEAKGTIRLGKTSLPALRDPQLLLEGEDDGIALKNDLLVDLYRGPASFETFSLIDLFLCLDSDARSEYFAENFKDKVIMLGMTTEVEDRKLTSVRYAQTSQRRVPTEPCIPRARPAEEKRPRTLIPGVYLHAAAISNLVDGRLLHPLERPQQTLATALVAILVGLLTLHLSSAGAALAFGLVSLGWVAVTLWAFLAGVVQPLLHPLVGSGVTMAALLGYRFAVTDRTERHIRQAFGRVLAPSLVERMVQRKQMPTQGGELREITVWVSDLANYTTISEILSPPDLVDFLNEVYTVMSDTVEEHDGFVAQFVGDAVVAGFNVPLDDGDHARHGIEAAMACCREVERLGGEMDLPEGFELRIRVGISTGDLLVGYIGSKRRLSYTIVGDDINLASRLEGVNKVYGSTILVNEITKDLCGPSIAFREIDVVRVKGRDAPVRIFEPLGPADDLSEAQSALAERYAEGLAAFRSRHFTRAVEIFDALAEQDPVSREFAQRARDFAAEPPPDDWDGVHNLLSK